MTVKELIARLEALNLPDAEVMIAGEDDGFDLVRRVDTRNVKETPVETWTASDLELADASDGVTFAYLSTSA
ncbi:MAG TPA: hypothetical protein VNX29_08870 [Kaistia sp.]|nr:hypothetical protein [Kaistia sp.]